MAGYHHLLSRVLFRSAVAATLILWSVASGDVIHSTGLPPGSTNIPAPDVEWIASPNHGSRGSTIIDSIVIHTTEVSYQGTLDIFLDPATQVSAHFVIASDGHIVQMVDTSRRAWHATYFNSRSVGIEMVGYANSPSTWNTNNLSALMDLLAWLVTAYDVPLVHPGGDAYDYPNDTFNTPGLVAHGQIQPWNRTDPGPYFPWQSVLDGTQAIISAFTGDLNGDGFVGIGDLNIVLGNWNLSVPPANPMADPSGDGFVGIEDLNTVLGNWNTGTPPLVLADIPEPSTLFLSGLLGLGLLKPRRSGPART